MKKLFWLFVICCCYGMANPISANAGITFAVDAANVELPDYKLKTMSLEERKEYCTGFGYKLIAP